MANPEVTSSLDGVDKMTVLLYRAALSGAALLLLFHSLQFYLHIGFNETHWQLGMVMVAGISAFALHVYDKTIRTLLQGAGWSALLLGALDAPPSWVFAACCVLLAGLSFKERFCFAIAGIKWLPLLFSLLWLCEWMPWPAAAALISGITGALLARLCLAKWQMPLHFDIGDKRRYQL